MSTHVSVNGSHPPPEVDVAHRHPAPEDEGAERRPERDRLKALGARVLGDGEPRIGAHGKPVLFLHPKDFTGTLVELEEA